jgi:ABC-type multidrug transport system fused ATPase/permease subunit
VPSTTDSAPQLRLPDRLTPTGYLLAVLRARPWLAVAATVTGTLYTAPGALLPVIVGQGIEAISAKSWPEVWRWTLAAALLGVAQAVFGTTLHFAGYGMWLHGAGTTQRAVGAHAARLGATLREKTTTGNVVAIASSDVNYLGNVFEVVGRTIGSAIVFVVVGVALLSSSPLLGAVALIGVPLSVLGIGPLLKPLRTRKASQREDLSEVNALSADIVSGLRILRGVGGERQFLGRFRGASQRVRLAGIEVGRSEAWLSAAEVALPGLVTIAITWLGARLAVDGTISVGQLVGFYGVSAFLVYPVTTITDAASSVASGLVSARKVCGLLSLTRTLPDPASPVALPAGALGLYDSETSITIEAGKLTVIDAGTAAEHLADRLTRFAEAADGEQVLIGGIPADNVALAELRRRVVYSHNQDIWFSGILREQVAPVESSGVGLSAALYAADADDIVEGLPDGVEEVIGERGREVSGGQRQRLSLARALSIDADVLVLDEPTSAVDAHTEARITERVAKLRQGRTTVVFSQSPLWTHVADEVLNLKVPA